VRKGLRPLEIYWHPLGWRITPVKNHWHIVSKWSHSILCHLEVARPNCGPLLYHKDNEWWKLTFRPMATTVVLHPWASKGGKGPFATPGFWKFQQKRLFSWFWVGKKTNFTTFGLPGKILEKSLVPPPLEKILPTPMVTS